MKHFILSLMCFFLLSCSPKLHIKGSAMRYHNLSQNKYQPNKHRKQVKVGTSPNSFFWFMTRKF
jgi:hypothetical protein